MNRLLFLTIVLIGVAACNNTGGNRGDQKDGAKDTIDRVTADTSPLAGDGHQAANSLDWQGVYKGIVPCAGCEGIDTEIRLGAGNHYELSWKYLGKNDNNGFKRSEQFKWTDGSAIELGGLEDGASKYFVGEGYIVQLDLAGNRIKGDLADRYVLKKIK